MDKPLNLETEKRERRFSNDKDSGRFSFIIPLVTWGPTFSYSVPVQLLPKGTRVPINWMEHVPCFKKSPSCQLMLKSCKWVPW